MYTHIRQHIVTNARKSLCTFSRNLITVISRFSIKHQQQHLLIHFCCFYLFPISFSLLQTDEEKKREKHPNDKLKGTRDLQRQIRKFYINTSQFFEWKCQKGRHSWCVSANMWKRVFTLCNSIMKYLLYGSIMAPRCVLYPHTYVLN